MPRKRKDNSVDPVASQLEEDIIFGRLRPLERVTEEDIMTRFGLTRHLSRRVMGRLRDLGIVTDDRRGGTIVRAFDPTEVEQIYEVRELLQERAMLRMPLPVDPTVIGRLRMIQEQHADAVSRRDLAAIFRFNDAFHDAVFDQCGNPALAEAIRHYTRLTHGVRSRVFTDPSHLARVVAEHGGMIEAMATGDRAALVELNRRHVNHPKLAYLAAQPMRPEQFASVG